MSCIHRRNPVAGFVGQHRRFCGIQGCDEDAEWHVHLGFWCANVCLPHANHYRKNYAGAEIVNQIYISEEQAA